MFGAKMLQAMRVNTMATKKNQCTGCKKRFIAVDMIKKPVGKFCTIKCMLAYALKPPLDNAKKVERLRDKEHALRKKVMNDTDLTKQHKLTQDVFNRLRKLQEFKWFADRNIEPYCISCEKTNMDWCCGHYASRGSQGALRYDLKNTYLQCNRACNCSLSANMDGNKHSIGYRLGLLRRFGDAEGMRIIKYCTRDRIKKWECQELIEMRAAFNVEIKQLKG
jgi:hypothetical protein